MKTLDDIRQDKTLQSLIHWDMKPRPRIQRTKIETEQDMNEIRKQLQARVGYYFYIEARFGQTAIYLYENYPDGSGKYVAEITEVPEEMLHGAVQEAGGNVKKDGNYPINDQVKNWLQSRLKD